MKSCKVCWGIENALYSDLSIGKCGRFCARLGFVISKYYFFSSFDKTSGQNTVWMGIKVVELAMFSCFSLRFIIFELVQLSLFFAYF